MVNSQQSTIAPGHLARLAREVAAHTRSAEDLVAESIARIERAADLNAVVCLRADRALAEARALDAALLRGQRAGPLAGLPLLVKDIEDAAGLPTTFGSLLHAGDPPASSDAWIPARLRRAGAIVVGKTNTPEFAFEAYTANRVFGATRNPWAPAYSPGGSSGGSAAALAAGLAALATATDGGGSIRIPAALCGLVGIKPTNGVVARNPLPDWIDLSTHGPMCQSVADLAVLLRLEAGPAPGDPSVQERWRLGTLRPPKLVFASRRLGSTDPIEPGVERLFTDALRAIESDLHIPVELVDLDRIFPGGIDPEDWFRVAGPEQAHRIGQATLERDADSFDPVFLHWMQLALRVPIEDHLAARFRSFRYARELDELLGTDRVLITPPLTVKGWSPDGRLPGAKGAGLPSWVFNTGEVNMTGHPAMSLPAGRHPEGVPFGIQVVGPRFRENLLFGFATRWEEARPWPLVADGFAALGL